MRYKLTSKAGQRYNILLFLVKQHKVQGNNKRDFWN